jgi:chemotaxis protein methyltransferase CheR
MKDILPLSPDDFCLFQKLLIEASGLRFDEGRNQVLHHALWQRLQHRGYDSYREYYNLLKFHPEGRLEIRELLDLVTIGETYFFRNKAQFDVLMRFVLPGIIQRKGDSGDKCIRAWSAGCSRGDEAYSIAMAMMEVFPSFEEWRISILGTDINRTGLACSEEAAYGEKDIGHLLKEYVEKYFKSQGSTYLLRDDVKELVAFEYHNLARDPYLHETMQNVDIIFCRNVIIYFDSQATQRVLENFYNCLAQDGYLFLGHTETLWQITDRFERVEFPQTFIYKKRLGPIQEDATKPFMAVPEIDIENLTLSAGPIRTFGAGELTSVEETGTEQRSFPQGSGRGLQEKPEPFEQVEDSTLRVDKPPDAAFLASPDTKAAQDKNHILTRLAKATILANEAKYKEAADILGKIVEADNLSVEAYYLLGVLSYKSGDLKEAEAQFRKVIYVTPDSILAYFNLGNMYLYQRKLKEAAREFRNAIRLLEKRPKDEQVRFCEDFTVEFLLRACRNTLAQISQRGG